ncbi:CaiB/BaiF CoA transferase family protein [Alicycliphilus denitrificans]|uniref:CaiB/BaiF CoA transferase family protein n=1 Tax=Alicycliphilus denitrificans TaxID=179636 RepID=UPI0001DA0B1B|nr:CoA transferase [Alicycliphilus denitrificans]ADV00688.1 L-carnitine dehydratase/bile acid-inducible protein F [Alicycliphilus denitrificans BC]GAO24191.1 L-carnitine dehydratase [Alicycliphilus sp. B1]
MQHDSPSDLPLAGFTVVELSDSASAPFAGHVLAGLGAEVWKVERPGGDSARGWGPSQWKGCGAAFHAINRGKRSICLDIKDPVQLATLHDLIERHADVFLHNLRPGSSGQYRLDPESLRARKPSLVVCEVGAYGHVGPLNTLPGYDPLMQAFSGIMMLTGEDGQAPVRAGVSIVDFGTGMWAVIGIVSALLRRERRKIGATVNSSLLETAIAWMSIGIANYAADGDPGGRHGSGVAFIVPHRAYEAADGYAIISAANDRLFARLAEALGHPEWGTDPKFATNAGRLANRQEIDGLIGQVMKRHTREYWQKHFDGFGLPCASVQTTAELYAHEQTRALGILGKTSEDEIDLVGVPLSFDRQRPPPLDSAPEFGQDNERLQKLLQAG